MCNTRRHVSEGPISILAHKYETRVIHNPLGNLAKDKPPHYELTPSNLDAIILPSTSTAPSSTRLRIFLSLVVGYSSLAIYIVASLLPRVPLCEFHGKRR